MDVAARLGEFGKLARVIWSADDEFFPVEDGRRLADLISELAAAEAPR